MEFENMVFARDYTVEPETQVTNTDREEFDQLLDILRKSKLFKDFEIALNAIPKMIVPEYKAAYDDLLNRLDKHTNQYGGKIRGEINYKTGSAWIEVILPFFEAVDVKTRQLFADVIQASLSMNFTATNDGNVRLYALLPYFEDLCEDETNDELLMQELLKHPDIIGAMEKQIAREYTTIERMLQNKFFRQKIGLAGEIVTGESAEDFIQSLKQEAKKDPLRFLALLEQIGISLGEMLSGESFPVC